MCNPPWRRTIAFLIAFSTPMLGACHGGGSGTAGNALLPQSSAGRDSVTARGHLGSVLSTKDGGQIFGFDINQNGTDGVLASARDTNKPGQVKVSVETFDQNSGAVTGSFAVQTGSVNSYAVDGIFAGDVALVTHYVIPKGSIFANRRYQVVSPVTAQKFTGVWTPPVVDVDVLQHGVNQTSATGLLFAIELKNQDNPDLIVTDVATNTISKVIHLDPNLFGGANGPQLGQYVAGNQGVIALSPDAGAVGLPGAAPINVVFDLATGASTRFTGFNNGSFGSGYVNGLGVDPNTSVAATTTELNAQVEFYNIAKRTGIKAAQLPCTSSTSQLNSGAGVGVDPVHKLFLVADPTYACSAGSALVIYDETGKLIETITGFKFAIAEPAVVLNPSLRMGWAFGPRFNQLQQFFY
ncbi:MAG: hypothetical protein ABI282_07070 [Candidatus Baltobacteraceae bacterium]